MDKSYPDIQLTVLIPFMNEGEEVVATVADVRRTAGNQVDVVVLNDCSTDGYPYEEELKPYNATYVCNPQNLGSAPSRDVCVSLCKTPFFLFLDAHMRFYCSNWVCELVEILSKNDRQLLCGQTLPIVKDINGVHVEPNHASVFGAYMPLSRTEVQPDIKWNGVEMNKESNAQEIPMILGAAYAGSTCYWKYLKGMEGMSRYGTEEQSVSLKAWLEGGRCLLLKDFVVGHIYRKKSPFKRYSEIELFNKLWIVSLLFPASLKAKSFAIAKSKDVATFNEAMKIFESKAEEYKCLKSYYDKIFTQTFEVIVNINKPLIIANAKGMFGETEECLPVVADFLEKNISDCYGLFSGRMGQIVWLEHYYAYTGDGHWDDLATQLWESVSKAVDGSLLPWYFSTGLTGIGWALYYLFDKGFIEELPEQIFSTIDSAIMVLDLSKISDTSLNTGLAGILAYCSMRVRFSAETPYSSDFMQQLFMAAETIIGQSCDFHELSFAYYFKELYLNGNSSYDVPMSLSDVMDYQTSFAENKDYWSNSLNGATLSATMRAMNYTNA